MYNFFRLENTLFTGIEVTEDRIFLAMPRLREGVPVTLATIPRATARGSAPILRAYPDWSAHVPPRGDFNCTGLVSVYRMKIDSCNRLWVSIKNIILLSAMHRFILGLFTSLHFKMILIFSINLCIKTKINI